jgi:hypothetical protein
LVKQAQGTHRNAKESLKLTTSNKNELEYIAMSVVIDKGTINRVKMNQLDVSQGHMVSEVNEFSNVLPKELSVVPPDHNIEFVIEWYLYSSHV